MQSQVLDTYDTGLFAMHVSHFAHRGPKNSQGLCVKTQPNGKFEERFVGMLLNSD